MARFFTFAVAAVLLATTVLAAPFFGDVAEGGVKGPKKCHHGPPTDVPTYFPTDLPTDVFPPPSDSASVEEPTATEIDEVIEGAEEY